MSKTYHMINNVYDIFISDLRQYGQHNPAPKSFTIKENDDFRHYELSDCFGLVAYNSSKVLICELHEDDDNWYCFNNTDKYSFDASWIKTKIELYSRMQKWLDENLFRTYYKDYPNIIGKECGYKYI